MTNSDHYVRLHHTNYPLRDTNNSQMNSQMYTSPSSEGACPEHLLNVPIWWAAISPQSVSDPSILASDAGARNRGLITGASDLR